MVRNKKEVRKKIDELEKQLEETRDGDEKDSLKIKISNYKDLLALKKENGGYIF